MLSQTFAELLLGTLFEQAIPHAHDTTGTMSGDRPKEFYISDKWDKCTDLAIRRVVYGTLGGTAAALILFRRHPTAANGSHHFLMDSMSVLALPFVVRHVIHIYGRSQGVAEQERPAQHLEVDSGQALRTRNVSERFALLPT